jgi:hypothetical protein
VARPRKEIDADEVYEWAKDGCTQEEIANHFGCARSVISERFRQEFELGKAASKTSLRRMQFDKARAGSDTMLIHLGKVYLGQTDKTEIHQTTELSIGPSQDLEEAIRAFGYIRPGETMGAQKPGALCDTGEQGAMADQGCASSQGAQ